MEGINLLGITKEGEYQEQRVRVRVSKGVKEIFGRLGSWIPV